MADPNKPNRIEVDLQLLADKDLARMETIFKQFGESVGKMQTALDGFEKQIQSAANAVSGGGGGIGTSRAGPATVNHPDPTTTNSPEEKLKMEREARMKQDTFKGLGRYAFGQNISEYERQAFTAPRFGSYTLQDTAKLFSHLASKAAFTDEGNLKDSRFLGVSASKWGTAAGGLGSAARVMPYIDSSRLVFHRLARAAAIPRAIAQPGTALGYNPSNGILGTPIGSSAFMNTIGQQWDAAKQSWFGLNPNYSSGEATAARSAITNFGYTGAAGDQYASQLKNIYESTGMSATETMPMMDKATRFGGASIQQFSAAMQQVPGAAQAARMGLQQFIADLDTTATSLAQNTNMSYATAFSTAQGMSASTGLAPQEAVKPLSNNLYTLMRVAKSGGNWYQATMGGFQGSQSLGQVSTMIHSITGFSLDQMKGLKTRDPAAFQAAMNKLIPIARFNPEILGGYSIKDILTLGEHGNAVGRLTARNAISMGMMTNHNGGRTSISSIEHDLGWSAGYAGSFNSQHAHDTYKEKLKAITDSMNKGDARMGKNAQQRITLDLTPDAKKLVQVQDTNAKRTDYANGNGSFPLTGVGGGAANSFINRSN